jgi:hypothetical protein
MTSTRAIPLAALLVGTAMLGEPSATAAQPVEPPARVPVTVEWVAPGSCPGRAAALAQLAQILRHPPTTDARQPLSARVQITEAAPGAWDVRVELRTPLGESTRALSGRSCARLTEAAALVLAIAIDPNIASALTTPPPSREPPAPTAGPRVQMLARLEATGDLGTLPSLGVGPAVALGLIVGWTRLEVAGTYLPAQRLEVPALAGSGNDISLFAGALRVALGVPLGALEIGPTVAGEVGILRAVPFGLAEPMTGNRRWVALLAGLALSWRLVEELAIRAGLEIGASVVRPRILITELGIFHEPSPVLGRLSLGVELRLP